MNRHDLALDGCLTRLAFSLLGITPDKFEVDQSVVDELDAQLAARAARLNHGDDPS
jgi:hypothetical protein